MPTADEVNDLFRESIEELQTVLETPGISANQRKAAELALRDVFRLHGTHVIQEVNGRTALLSGLIVELEEVSNAVKLNPIGEALDQLDGLITRARDLHHKAKAELQ